MHLGLRGGANLPGTVDFVLGGGVLPQFVAFSIL
jgi:hypothetical protein